MLSEELLRWIQADRAREIAAADRVRWLRPDGPGPDVAQGHDPRSAMRRSAGPRRAHTGTGSTAATDPCL